MSERTSMSTKIEPWDDDAGDDPAEDAYLRAESEAAFGPLEAALGADVVEMMREVFELAAAMHPVTTRNRRRALQGGRVERSGTRVKQGASSAEPKASRAGRRR